MTLRSRVTAHLFALAALLAVLSPIAIAQSRQERAVGLLEQRMAAAEHRYREALVLIGNNDPAGATEADAALEDMEDVVVACGKQRGCHPATMLATYKRLLKQDADAMGLALPEPGLDPDDADPDHRGVAGDVPEAARAAKLLADGHHFDAMVEFNPAVQQAIRRWLTDMRPELMTSYENYQYLRHEMWPHYERAGLPEALLFGIMAKESHGRVHATSRAGAAGPMQFMYTTGTRFGLGQDATGFDTRYDPNAASEASVAYLRERFGELNRNIELSLAAYNGGEGRARRIHRENPGRGFWDAQVYEQFPEETRDYVPMVVAAAWLFLHPQQYGLEFPDVTGAEPATLVLSRPASIYELTICLGNNGARNGYMRALRNLNPRYDADSWLPAGTKLDATVGIVNLYQTWCMQGPRAELAQRLVNSDPGAAIVRGGAARAPVAAAAATAAVVAPPKRDYSVQRGETLNTIARKFGCSVKRLADANDIRAPRYTIRPGQTLRLEGCSNA